MASLKMLGVTLLLVLGMTLSFAMMTRAQSVASMSGRVLDNGGASVPDAKVTVKNIETGETRTATTDQDGAYRVLSLAVGRYELRIEKEGFKASVRSGIDLVVGQEAALDIALEVGSLTQEVTVSAEAPVVNTTTAETSGLVDEQQVKTLPLNGRSFDNLITLDAGATSDTALKPSSTGGGAGNLFSIAGRRPEQNLFLLNGVEYGGDASESNSPGSVSGQLLGIDAIREFNVMKGNYSAEYGKRAGGQITIVTTSGTNQIHGSVFEFLRNSDMDARNFFDQQPSALGARIPHFERNNFGGSLGGPIKKDKTFLFGNYEGFRQLLGLSDQAIVPDANARLGLLPCSSVIPAPSPCTASSPLVNVAALFPVSSAAAKPFFSLFSLPNGPEVLTTAGLPTGAAYFASSPIQRIREDFATSRFDHSFSDKDSFNAVYTVDDGVSFTPSATGVSKSTYRYRAQVGSLSEVHIFSPDFLNTATVGYSRAHYETFSAYNFNTTSLSIITSGAATGFPVGLSNGFSVSGGLVGAGGGGPSSSARNLATYTDSLQITKGIHLISFGVWFERIQDNDNTGLSGGTANFSSLETLIQGQYTSFSASPYPTPRGFRSLEGAWFVADTIRLRPNLTVNVGLRHEFTNGWNEATGRNAAYVPGTVNQILQSAPLVQASPLVVNNAKLLLEPRLGVAWDVFGNGKTAVHAGAGIYHDLQDELAYFNNKNLPWNDSIAITAGSLPLPLVTAQNVSTYPGALPFPYFTDPFLKTPSVYSYDLKIEQSLGKSTAVSIAYTGFHSTHNNDVQDWNTVIPVICGSTPGNCTNITSVVAGGPLISLPNGTEFFPGGTLVRRNPAMSSAKGASSNSDSNYNGMLLEVDRRVAHGLMFKANYTWSKEFDEASQFVTAANCASTPLDPGNLKFDYGLSCWDIRNKAVFSGIYDLPVGKGGSFWTNPGHLADEFISGWQVAPIVSVISGHPFDPELGFSQDRNGNTSIPDRPSFNSNFSGNLYPHTVTQWYNAAAFSLPPLGTYGNVPRNYIISPGLAQVDLSLQKNFAIPLREDMRLQFRAEGFNIFNRANLGLPLNLTLNTDGSVRSTAGTITSTGTTSRQLQMALKLIW